MGSARPAHEFHAGPIARPNLSRTCPRQSSQTRAPCYCTAGPAGTATLCAGAVSSSSSTMAASTTASSSAPSAQPPLVGSARFVILRTAALARKCGGHARSDTTHGPCTLAGLGNEVSLAYLGRLRTSSHKDALAIKVFDGFRALPLKPRSRTHSREHISRIDRIVINRAKRFGAQL